LAVRLSALTLNRRELSPGSCAEALVARVRMRTNRQPATRPILRIL
jgi:hypothetical protein